MMKTWLGFGRGLIIGGGDRSGVQSWITEYAVGRAVSNRRSVCTKWQQSNGFIKGASGVALLVVVDALNLTNGDGVNTHTRTCKRKLRRFCGEGFAKALMQLSCKHQRIRRTEMNRCKRNQYTKIWRGLALKRLLMVGFRRTAATLEVPNRQQSEETPYQLKGLFDSIALDAVKKFSKSQVCVTFSFRSPCRSCITCVQLTCMCI